MLIGGMMSGGNAAATPGGGGMAIGGAVSGATATRVPYIGAGPVLADSALLTFTVGSGLLSASILRATGLTSGRVALVTTGGSLADDAALTFAAGNLSATSLQATGLTSGRIPFAGASGLLGDNAGLTYATTAGLTARNTDAAAAATVTGATLVHQTSATPTIGIACALEFQNPDAVNTLVGSSRVVGMNRGVTAGSTVGAMIFQTWNSGAWTNSGHCVNGAIMAASTLGLATINATGVPTNVFTMAITSLMVNMASASGSNGGFAFTGTVNTSGARQFFTITPSANTGGTASTEIKKFEYAAYTNTWATGAITTQREVVWNAPTYAFVGPSTITTAATVAITNAPQAGTNATLTKALALWVQAGLSQFDGRVIANAPDSAIADAALAASSFSFYLNEAGNTLTVKVKYADGTTVKTGTIALA